MTRTHIRFTLIGITTLVAAAIFVTTFLSSTIFASVDTTDTSLPVPQTKMASAGAVTPERVKIPKIDVDALVEHVGLGKTGNMAVPIQYGDAGWYRGGAVPGDVGSAVLDGHVDNGLGNPAVFARLGELVAGDDIYIEGENGQELHFVVEEAHTYNLGDIPREKIFNRTDKPRLNLITCDGTWMPDEKMYNERHVVYAVLAL